MKRKRYATEDKIRILREAEGRRFWRLKSGKRKAKSGKNQGFRG
jgi:hypothetical protein